MFRQFTIFLAILAVTAFSAPTSYPTEEQLKSELASAGMTQGSIDGLMSLTNRFATGYPLVQSNKEATDKFISEYTNDANNFIKAMSPEDQKIYNAHLKKYGLA
ncbi:hypothetical protein GCK72_020266 [Caenorhabditis remanei]|uniref:SXP/RAL-2 family protein Ani s 5-like cation-binding domain-containing protein n=1 Tax=Caenorhabditis remanei TaxID=31234 RepID=A0A6A5GGZ3_CAERE|nr:hypothetical protein GCK72_020266 [Caenorhabditis remanei]KAF1753709.1 hypothetical protein GCK72_020266 [Caenorhabditis remanei]